MKTCIVLLVGAALLLGACSSGSGGGDDGDTSQPTVKWFVEKGPPSNSQGVNGDLYLDQDAALLYVKVNGQWQPAASLRGPSGSGWLFGSGVPASTLGSDGDLYLDTSTSFAYRKMNGSWGMLFALKGDTGATGTQWYSGANAPTSNVPSTARAGDYYLQTSTAMIYKKDSNGSWSSMLVLSYSTPSFIYTPHMMSWDSEVSFNAVAYGTSGYVAVGNYGSIVHSTDGTNWKLLTYTRNFSKLPKGLESEPDPEDALPENFIFYDVAFGNGKYVPVGYYEPEGPVCLLGVSSNGVSWYFTQLGNFRSNHVTFQNGMFFVSTDSGVIYTSTDGSSWTPSSGMPAGRSLSTVIYGNDKYIVFSSYANGVIEGVYTSTNGTHWSPAAPMTGITSGCRVYSVVFGSGLFVAVGRSGPMGVAIIWISTDGISWSSQDLPVTYSTEFLDIAYGNGFALVGYDDNYGLNLIMTSANGISWTMQTLPNNYVYYYGYERFSGIASCSPAGTFVIAKGVSQGEGEYSLGKLSSTSLRK